jgi:hypothetical protein
MSGRTLVVRGGMFSSTVQEMNVAVQPRVQLGFDKFSKSAYTHPKLMTTTALTPKHCSYAMVFTPTGRETAPFQQHCDPS